MRTSGGMCFPGWIQVERLRKMIAFLGLEPASILRFAGYSQKEINKEEIR